MYTRGSFCWRECATRDAAAAKAFYGDLFGWSAVDHPEPAMDGAYVILQRDGLDVAGLYELDGPRFAGVPPHWATYVWHDDVDAALDRARALGAEALCEPFDVPGVGRLGVLKDPQGAVVQLLDGAEGACAQVVDASPGSFCWSELWTTDVEGAGRFYGDLFGWRSVAREMAPGWTYTSLLQGEHPVGGMLPLDGDALPGIPPHWMNYVSVADTDGAVARAADLGGHVLTPPTDVPGVGRYATLQDPTGATLSVITLVARGG